MGVVVWRMCCPTHTGNEDSSGVERRTVTFLTSAQGGLESSVY